MATSGPSRFWKISHRCLADQVEPPRRCVGRLEGILDDLSPVRLHHYTGGPLPSTGSANPWNCQQTDTGCCGSAQYGYLPKLPLVSIGIPPLELAAIVRSCYCGPTIGIDKDRPAGYRLGERPSRTTPITPRNHEVFGSGWVLAASAAPWPQFAGCALGSLQTPGPPLLRYGYAHPLSRTEVL